MAINVKNLITGEVVDVPHVEVECDGIIHAEGSHPCLSTQFFEHYTFLSGTGQGILCLYNGKKVRCVRLILARGYKLITK